MTSFVASALRSSSLAPRRHSLGRMVKSSTLLLLTVIAALIVVLAMLILFHHNLNATKGYRLRSLERARSQLLLEQETLNMKIAEAQALQIMQNDPQILAMQKPVKPKYVKAGTVAKGVAERLLVSPIQ